MTKSHSDKQTVFIHIACTVYYKRVCLSVRPSLAAVLCLGSRSFHRLIGPDQPFLQLSFFCKNVWA